jgi:hypothetical protein
VAGRQIKLGRVIFKLAIGTLLLLSLALAVPVTAGTAALTGSFTVRLVASNIAALSIGDSYANISWETNGDASSQVLYDTIAHENTDDYTYHSNNNTAPVSHHIVSLTGLSPSTTYHYRVKSAATVNGSDFAVLSDDHVFQTGSPPINGYGGGGWGGVITQTVSLTGITGTNALILNSSGFVQSATLLTTPDGLLWLEIPAGARILDAQGQLPNALSVIKPATPPPPSQDVPVLFYAFSPAGVTFSPPVKLTMKYDLANLPAGVKESTLYIAYWDGSQWQALPSTVDTQTSTVSALISRLASVALMGKMAIPTPVQTIVPTSLPATTPPPSISTPALTTTTITTPAPSQTPAPTTSLTQTPTSAETTAPVSSPATTSFWWILGGSLAAALIILTAGWIMISRHRRK